MCNKNQNRKYFSSCYHLYEFVFFCCITLRPWKLHPLRSIKITIINTLKFKLINYIEFQKKKMGNICCPCPWEEAADAKSFVPPPGDLRNTSCVPKLRSFLHLQDKFFYLGRIDHKYKDLPQVPLHASLEGQHFQINNKKIEKQI